MLWILKMLCWCVLFDTIVVLASWSGNLQPEDLLPQVILMQLHHCWLAHAILCLQVLLFILNGQDIILSWTTWSIRLPLLEELLAQFFMKFLLVGFQMFRWINLTKGTKTAKLVSQSGKVHENKNNSVSPHVSSLLKRLMDFECKSNVKHEYFSLPFYVNGHFSSQHLISIYIFCWYFKTSNTLKKGHLF